MSVVSSTKAKPTIIASTTFEIILAVSDNPFHFRLLFLLILFAIDASTLEPLMLTKMRPSPVPAARVPSGDMAMAVMKGGGEEKPGVVAGKDSRGA